MYYKQSPRERHAFFKEFSRIGKMYDVTPSKHLNSDRKGYRQVQDGNEGANHSECLENVFRNLILPIASLKIIKEDSFPPETSYL